MVSLCNTLLLAPFEEVYVRRYNPNSSLRGGGGILVKYVEREPILKNHMLVVVTLKEKVLYVIPN